MNKAKKEEARKVRETYENLSPEELQEFERKQRVMALAREIHSEMFPEEYDFMMDSNADANDRRRGINPMSERRLSRIYGLIPASRGPASQYLPWLFVNISVTWPFRKASGGSLSTDNWDAPSVVSANMSMKPAGSLESGDTSRSIGFITKRTQPIYWP